MSILNVNTSDPDLFKKRTYEPIPGSVYAFTVANALKLEDSKSTPGNKVVKIELRVVDDGEFKGKKVFDNLVITKTDKEKSEWKIAQFAVACGIMTQAQIKAGEGIDLDLFQNSICKARVSIKVEKYQGEDVKKNVVKEYLFEEQFCVWVSI